MLEDGFNQTTALLSQEEAITMGEISAVREVLDISMEVTSKTSHQQSQETMLEDGFN